MDHRRWTMKRGFTLVELLVTIGIIAILVSILVPVTVQALKKAEIAKAQTEMAHIRTAIKAYYDAYGLMPTPDTNGMHDHTFGRKNSVSGKHQDAVMDILRALDTPNNPSHEHNPRRIVFLEVPAKAMAGQDKAGATYTASDGYYLDPWETPYMIIMDTDFDGEVGGVSIDNGEGQNDYVCGLSPLGNCTFQGVTIGVMSYGPKPSEPEKSFLKSW